MVSDYKEILSDSAKGMKRSAIRELLKLTQKPEIISFAGGLPAKESFPLEQLQEICAEVIATSTVQPKEFLNYWKSLLNATGIKA